MFAATLANAPLEIAPQGLYDWQMLLIRLSLAALTFVATGETGTAQDCHPSYEGACLPVGQGDVDCAGGSGNGPHYVRGPVYVVGPDEYELDRDGDGIACEPEKARR
jgi:hypothetical protein